jgi:uncharacterized protein (TIGR02145 family)
MKKIFFLTVFFLMIISSCNCQQYSNFFWSYPQEQQITPVKYGYLYNWYAVTYSTGGASIAPVGWHVPTRLEFYALGLTLGGANYAGGKLKETGYDYWNSPNTGATNGYNYVLRGTGLRNETGSFSGINQVCYLWASNSYDATYAYCCQAAVYNSSYFGWQALIFKVQGCPIRLIKDDSIDPGILIDYDGNIYATVKIGSQVWTVQNFICTHFNDGTSITEVQNSTTWSSLTSSARCVYNNDESNAKK